MFNGQWFGKYEGLWGGSVTESPPGSMFGVSTLVFLATGSLTAKSDSWLPIDSNYYPFVADPYYETASIEGLYSASIIDSEYASWPINYTVNQVSIDYDHSVFNVASQYNLANINSGYNQYIVESGYKTWQLN